MKKKEVSNKELLNEIKKLREEVEQLKQRQVGGGCYHVCPPWILRPPYLTYSGSEIPCGITVSGTWTYA